MQTLYLDALKLEKSLCSKQVLIYKEKNFMSIQKDGLLSSEPLMRLGWFYIASKPLVNACKVYLFTWVSRGFNTPQLLARATGLTEKSASFLLEAMISLELLSVDLQGNFSNTKLASQYLDADKPHYMGDTFIKFGQETIDFANQQIRLSTPPASASVSFDENNLRPRDMAVINGTAVHGLTSASSMVFGRFFDFTGYKYLLDIAGGQQELPFGRNCKIRICKLQYLIAQQCVT